MDNLVNFLGSYVGVVIVALPCRLFAIVRVYAAAEIKTKRGHRLHGRKSLQCSITPGTVATRYIYLITKCWEQGK